MSLKNMLTEVTDSKHTNQKHLKPYCTMFTKTSLKNIGNQSLLVLEVGSVDGGNEGKTVGSDEGSDVGT